MGRESIAKEGRDEPEKQVEPYFIQSFLPCVALGNHLGILGIQRPSWLVCQADRVGADHGKGVVRGN